ncbi:flavodoxin FldB [Gilvimarinus sp. F26214L]|uniref:flavodoxin FldB n=1 Tax=Gilvimarinus sp. DZF01 TaxID=3461371 RepID=UPI00404571A9
MRIGLFYGSSTCYTEIAAEKIRDYLAEKNAQVELHDVGQEPVAGMADYPLLILGIPTWDYGELQEDWESVWTELSELDLRHKKVALYGCGDQIGYPEWFQDALGYLHDQVLEQGATLCGYWPSAGYEFSSSMALSDDGSYFVGLALDEENEFELSDERIQRWCDQVLDEFSNPA